MQRPSTRCVSVRRGHPYLMPEDYRIVIVIEPRRLVATLREVGSVLLLVLMWAYLLVGLAW